jgi:hypothetical protein
MKRLTGLAVIISVISIFSIAMVYAQCPPDNIAMTKPDVYGAINHDKYEEMDTAIRNNNTDKLKSLIIENSVVEIPSGLKVCVLEESFMWSCKKIEVPGLKVPYWVDKDAVTKVK